MKCPVCRDTDLLMTDRNGIEIDYCPKCRGVWLDRGELDKIIERATTATPAPSQPSQPAYSSHDHGTSHGRGHGYGHKKKREGFLSELFDFD